MDIEKFREENKELILFMNDEEITKLMKDKSDSLKFIKEKYKNLFSEQSYKCPKYLYEVNKNYLLNLVNKRGWDYICCFEKLSEEFMREYIDFISFKDIIIFQKLSEEFIKDFQYKLDLSDWNVISAVQNLSEEFIKEFADKINWAAIQICQDLSKQFKNEIKGRVESTYFFIPLRIARPFARIVLNNFIKFGKFIFFVDESIFELVERINNVVSKKQQNVIR